MTMRDSRIPNEVQRIRETFGYYDCRRPVRRGGRVQILETIVLYKNGGKS